MHHLEFKKILVPVDFSDESFAAVDEALELVASARQLCVVHVLPQISRQEIGIVWIAEFDQERCARVLNELRSRLQHDKYRGIDLEVAIGDAAHQIVKAAEIKHATLIVMPSHGRTGCRQFLLGSVAERVTRLAECPVLVLKHPHDAPGERVESATVANQVVSAH